MKGLRLSHLLLFVAIAATVALHPAAPAAGQIKPAPGARGGQPPAPSSSMDAHTISLEIEAMRDAGVLSGGNNQALASAEEAARRHPIQVRPVAFDTARARQLGFSYTSIAVGQQLAAASNEIIANAARAQWRRTPAAGAVPKLDLVRYPALRQFFEALDRPGSSASPSLNSTARPKLLGRTVCGSYGNPKPSSAAGRVTFDYVDDPPATLRSWGYHETPASAGGGWTRPHHYHRIICGWNAFRDHATFEGTSITEQNYDGWSPRGEPNPEVWTVHPWAYADWPAYVAWWHDKY